MVFSLKVSSLALKIIMASALLISLTVGFRAMGSRASSVRSITALSGVKEKIAEYNKGNDVFVWSKSYCPYCNKAKQALTDLGVKYGSYELDQQQDGSEIQAALLDLTGQRTVPNIFVKNSHVGGCDTTLALIASGEFQKMLKK